jgi:TonB family protein
MRFDVPWLLEAQRQQLQPVYRRLKPKRTADQIVVHLTVQPNGTVSDLKLLSSTLKQPRFEAKLLSAIRQTQFGAGQYAVWSQSYRFEFKSSHKRR